MAIFVLTCAVSRKAENRWRARLASVLLDKLVPSLSSFDSMSRMVNGFDDEINYISLVSLFCALEVGTWYITIIATLQTLPESA